MATVTMAEIQQLIEAAVKAALAGRGKSESGRLDGRHFRRIDQLKTAVGS